MIVRISAILIMALMMIQATGYAQADSLGPDNSPAKPAFESGYLIDQQTTNGYIKNTLEFVIHHRFGSVKNEAKDLYGIYGASNIRFGLNYSFTKDLLIGIGTTKNKKFQDVSLKYSILKQTKSLSIPVSVSFFESVGLDGRSNSAFGTQYKFSDRFSYFSQLIISHRFNDMISLQVAPSFTHYNSADTLMDHDKVGISFAGRVKFSPQSSFVFGVDLPMKIKSIREYHALSANQSKPNISFGVDIETSAHAFQIFISTAQGIVPQEIMAKNNLLGSDKLLISQFMLGFNITRLWNF